ncbi:DUF3179 domain-containing protein [Litoreibacter roseus]|nr:DUF3179 domain-containing protein [Litoreibacter roseus]
MWALTLPSLGQTFGGPANWQSEWPRTDFSKASVDLDEIRSGGPAKDGIPAVDDPRFMNARQEKRLAPNEPVLTLEISGQIPRAYPIRYFMVHEIVNDTVGSVPVAVTFCPLCNSGMVFDRRVNGQTLDFGVTGKLRHSDMVMYDRQTESWWQQAVGRGIVGQYSGKRLKQVPSWMESWADFAARNPDGLVMDAPLAGVSYGRNPYVKYDSSDRPFLYDGTLPPGGIDPMARVVRVGSLAWPLSRLDREKRIVEAGVILTWEGTQASALDTARIGQGRAVNSVRVRDASGRDMPHDVMFAFAFHAFFPDGVWQLSR